MNAMSWIGFDILSPGANGTSLIASVASEAETFVRLGALRMLWIYDCFPVSQNQGWRLVFRRGSRSQ